jgi:hypothetical protein
MGYCRHCRSSGRKGKFNRRQLCIIGMMVQLELSFGTRRAAGGAGRLALHMTMHGVFEVGFSHLKNVVKQRCTLKLNNTGERGNTGRLKREETGTRLRGGSWLLFYLEGTRVTIKR